MYRRILQGRGDLREIHRIFPNHLLALLQLNTADIFTGRDLQVLVEQRRQVAGADVHHPCHGGNGQLLPNMGADILLGTANDLIFRMDGIGGLQPGILRILIAAQQ